MWSLTPNIIYRADVQCKANNDNKFYLGVAQISFKNTLKAQGYSNTSGHETMQGHHIVSTGQSLRK